MATNSMREALRHLREALGTPEDVASDGQLLERFLAGRDEAAFAVLVRRHGPMVWGVCRRILDNPQDAEDAFQATFLVLVRKAASIRDRATVGNWLHGVARQTAVRVRASRARQGQRERQVRALPEPGAPGHPVDDLAPLLDEELSRLPENYRAVLVLCDLEDRPRSEVARHLGCPEGTVAGRLARARALLADRLSRRGVTSANYAGGPVPPALLAATVEVALSGVCSATVASLTDGVLNAMFFTKLKFAGAALVVLACTLAGVLLYAATRPEPPKEPAPAVAALPFTLKVSAPKFVRPDPVNLPDFSFWEVQVQYRNESKQELVLSPYLTARVFDATGKAVPSNVFLGRGILPEDIMEAIEKSFLVVPAGATRTVTLALNNIPGELTMEGWHFKLPGTYKLELNYGFTRKGFLAKHERCFFTEEDAKKADLPARLWNRAAEGTVKAEVTFTVPK